MWYLPISPAHVGQQPMKTAKAKVRGHNIEFNLHSLFIEEATKLETVYLETLKNADCPLLAATI